MLQKPTERKMLHGDVCFVAVSIDNAQQTPRCLALAMDMQPLTGGKGHSESQARPDCASDPKKSCQTGKSEIKVSSTCTRRSETLNTNLRNFARSRLDIGTKGKFHGVFKVVLEGV